MEPQRAVQKKKTIALFITGVAGVILIVVMILWYRHDIHTGQQQSGKQLNAFYNTIQTQAQSLFDRNTAIIKP